VSAWRGRVHSAAAGLLIAVLCSCTSGAGQTQTVAGGSAASCAGPVPTTSAQPHGDTTQARPAAVSPGQALHIYGFWFQTCHDTNHQPRARPFRHLLLLALQGKARNVLARVSAQQPGGTFAITVRIPTGLHPGTATVRTSLMIEVPLRLTVRAR
jgi:hypothetical protein